MRAGRAAFAVLRVAAPLAIGTASFAISLPAGADPSLGERLFTEEAMPACGFCHTLAAAGTAGAIGPVLDDLKPDVARVRRAVTEGLGVMPSYGGVLSASEIDAVAAYVAASTGAD